MTIAASAANAASSEDTARSPDEGIEVDARTEEIILRSARNIAAWRSYLPAGCVAAMIAMGWDKTT